MLFREKGYENPGRRTGTLASHEQIVMYRVTIVGVQVSAPPCLLSIVAMMRRIKVERTMKPSFYQTYVFLQTTFQDNGRWADTMSSLTSGNNINISLCFISVSNCFPKARKHSTMLLRCSTCKNCRFPPSALSELKEVVQ